MSEMVERVARAVYEKIALDPDWDDAPLTEDQRVAQDDDPSQEACRAIARAAIAAMRDPTEGMCLAGQEAKLTIDFGKPPNGGIWRAMIDAALKE